MGIQLKTGISKQGYSLKGPDVTQLSVQLSVQLGVQLAVQSAVQLAVQRAVQLASALRSPRCNLQCGRRLQKLLSTECVRKFYEILALVEEGTIFYRNSIEGERRK